MLSAVRSSVSVPTHLPGHVSRSWERCHGLGLRRNMSTPLEPVGASEMHELLQRSEHLLKVARAEMQHLTAALRDTGHIAFVVDQHGFVVALAGDLHNADPVLQRLQRGVNLSEARCGTKAAGTVLVEKKPTLVQRSEHYLSELSVLDCFAAPILSPQGHLAGALTVSSSSAARLPGVADLIQVAAARMEQQLVRELASPLLLRLHPHAEGVDCAGAGLLAISCTGEVLGMNPSASRILGVEASAMRGRSLKSMFDGDPLQVLPLSGNRSVLRVRGGLGVSAQLLRNAAALQESAIPATHISTRSTRNNDLRLVDGLSKRELEVLNHLQLGLSNVQMAQRMSVSENAIKYHLKNIFSKLCAKTRLEAIKIARELGAIS